MQPVGPDRIHFQGATTSGTVVAREWRERRPGATLLVSGVALIGIPYYYFRILPPLKALGHVVCAYLVLGLGMATTVLADRTISRVLA